jgi:pimeloyl-ACP methyl ester carboxylesterase
MKNLLVLICLFLISGCMSATDVFKEEKAFFDQYVANNPILKQHSIETDNGQLFYVATGDPQKASLILIHGTPGGWDQQGRYLINESLLEKFYVIAIDRPGWGASTLNGEQVIADFETQARQISFLIERRKADAPDAPVILLGHSLGSSLAPRVAMDFPDMVDGLLLLAGTLSPEYSSPRWFNYLAAIPGVYWLIGEEMAKANKEIFALKDNINAMVSRWEYIDSHTMVVQGVKDTLVNPANIDFAKDNLSPEKSQFISLDDGHLIPFTRANDVIDWSLCLLEKVQANKNQCQSIATWNN